MRSAVYEGWVRHRRYRPARHAFRYRLAMLYLELQELSEVFRDRWLWSVDRPNLAWMRRADYLGDPRKPLDTAVRDLVQQRGAARPRGPIGVLTQIRQFGYCLNPVSFYYCYDCAGAEVETVVASITNTPWSEHHAYVLPARPHARGNARHRHALRKVFHVSPYMPMDHRYLWRFHPPGRRVAVHMENHDDRGRIFDATLAMDRRPMGKVSLRHFLTRHPAMTLRVAGGIYAQALHLWAKGAGFHSHPKHRGAAEEGAS